MRFRLYAWLFVFFVATQSLGVLVASNLVEEDVKVTLVSEDKDNPVNAVALIAYIIGLTAVVLVLMRFFKRRVFWLFEALAVFATTMIVVEVFLPGLGFMFAVLLVALRFAARQNIWLKNLASVFAVTGAGALIGISLGVIPVLVFICLLAVYDMIAVFKTKHMVKMAEALVSENLAFTFTIPTKEHAFQLGTGDLVIPLVFGIGIFSKASVLPFGFAVLPVAMVFAASILGLVGTLHICAEKKIALPALPMQTAYMVAVWGFCLFLGMPVL